MIGGSFLAILRSPKPHTPPTLSRSLAFSLYTSLYPSISLSPFSPSKECRLVTFITHFYFLPFSFFSYVFIVVVIYFDIGLTGVNNERQEAKVKGGLEEDERSIIRSIGNGSTTTIRSNSTNIDCPFWSWSRIHHSNANDTLAHFEAKMK